MARFSIPIKIVSKSGQPLALDSSYFGVNHSAGTQWDNGFAEIDFTRPAGFEELSLSVRCRNTVFQGTIILGLENKLTLVRPLTVSPILELSVVFHDGDTLVSQTGVHELLFTENMASGDTGVGELDPILHPVPGPPGPAGPQGLSGDIPANVIRIFKTDPVSIELGGGLDLGALVPDEVLNKAFQIAFTSTFEENATSHTMVFGNAVAGVYEYTTELLPSTASPHNPITFAYNPSTHMFSMDANMGSHPPVQFNTSMFIFYTE